MRAGTSMDQPAAVVAAVGAGAAAGEGLCIAGQAGDLVEMARPLGSGAEPNTPVAGRDAAMSSINWEAFEGLHRCANQADGGVSAGGATLALGDGVVLAPAVHNERSGVRFGTRTRQWRHADDDSLPAGALQQLRGAECEPECEPERGFHQQHCRVGFISSIPPLSRSIAAIEEDSERDSESDSEMGYTEAYRAHMEGSLAERMADMDRECELEREAADEPEDDGDPEECEPSAEFPRQQVHVKQTHKPEQEAERSGALFKQWSGALFQTEQDLKERVNRQKQAMGEMRKEKCDRSQSLSATWHGLAQCEPEPEW